MTIHPGAGKPAPPELLIDVSKLIADYYDRHPDPADPAQQVSFGTSGHRGSSSLSSFNEDHILAVCQAIAEFRKSGKTTGPLFLGMDTHALSRPAHTTALEVLAANGVELRIAAGDGYTPTPVISYAILTYNRGRREGLADGVVITPSHNPPDDGGIKYNPPSGGPADTSATALIEQRANRILAAGLKEVKRIGEAAARSAPTTRVYDYISPYVADLGRIVGMEEIAASGLSIGVDPMGGAGIDFWDPIADRYRINLTVVNRKIDPAFAFMTLDKDGKIRMDCSSPYAMASLIRLKDDFDIAFGNDTDYDRHGIVTRRGGLMNPNHYLAVAVDYLFRNRPGWASSVRVGKTLVSSSMIDRVAGRLGRELCEVPVGFKWFVEGLLDGSLGFGGEESAGASFLRRDGTVWTTDKDGFILDLLAAEITARTGEDPSLHYQKLEEEFGRPVYRRVDAPATPARKAALKKLSPEMVTASELAGEKILARLTHAPGNGAPIGGLKVVSESGWFAARPSGTENIYKIYAESFRDQKHLEAILTQAREIVDGVFTRAGIE